MNEWKPSQKDLESFCSESRSLGNELSLRFMPSTFLTTGHQSTAGDGKRKKSLRRLEERRKCREKSGGGGWGEEVEGNESLFFVYLKGEPSATGYHGDPGQNGPSPLAEMSEPMRRRYVGRS